jgi:hypothetical protein
MVWKALGVAALMTGVAGVAHAESVAKTLEDLGLIGAWANDCTLPPSPDNYRTIYKPKRSGEVARTYYDKPDHVYNNYKIVRATRQGPTEVSYRQVWDFEGSPNDKAFLRIDVVLHIEDNKIQVVSSKRSDGKYVIQDRKFVSDGHEGPVQVRCPSES